MKNFFSKNFLIGLATGAILSVASVSAAANLPSISNFTSGSVLRAADLQQIVQALTDLYGAITVTGNKVKIDKLQLGNKFTLSGVGDAHGNDTWLRLFSGADGTTWGGGFAAQNIWADKLNIGSKWQLSGVGDAHGNDSWLRLFKGDGSGYYGGIAMNDLWVNSSTHLHNLQNYADNAAAKAAGAGNGQLYRTGDVVKVVHD